MKIAIIGGTGKLGYGLAKRLMTIAYHLILLPSWTFLHQEARLLRHLPIYRFLNQRSDASIFLG